MSFNAALFTFSFLDTSVLHRNEAKKKQQKTVLPLFCFTFVTPQLKGRKKKPSQLEWTAVASSVCGVYLTDCWVKEKAEWDHVLQQPGLETYTCAEVRQLMQRRNPGGGHACRRGCRLPGGGWVSRCEHHGCHPSIHPSRRRIHSGIPSNSHTCGQQGAGLHWQRARLHGQSQPPAQMCGFYERNVCQRGNRTTEFPKFPSFKSILSEKILDIFPKDFQPV